LDFSLLYSTLFHLQPLALAVRRPNHSARSDPHIILLFVLIHYIGALKPSCTNGDAAQIRSANYEPDLSSRIFCLVRAASLFTLQTSSAQINLRVISRKVLFDPHRFLSNKSPIHLAGESGKGNMFLNANSTFKMKININRHGPRLMPSCKNLNPSYFSLPSTLKQDFLKFSLLPQVWAGTTCQKRRQLMRPEGGKAAAACRSRLLGATTWQNYQLTRDEGGKAAAGLCCLSLAGTTWTKWPPNRHEGRKPAQRSVFLSLKEIQEPFDLSQTICY
jgi:hypothetical protein